MKPLSVARESFKHKSGFVILEDVEIGVCDRCGNRYYSAEILHAVHEVGTGERVPERTEAVGREDLTHGRFTVSPISYSLRSKKTRFALGLELTDEALPAAA